MNFRKFLKESFPRVFRGRAFMVVGDAFYPYSVFHSGLQPSVIYWRKEYPLCRLGKNRLLILLYMEKLVEVKPR